MRLFTHDEVKEALEGIKWIPEYNDTLLDVTHGASSGQALTPEGLCYQASKNNKYERVEEDVPDFEELEDAPHPYCEGMLAKDMARLMAYLRKHGGWQLVTTPGSGELLVLLSFEGYKL